MPGSPLPCGLSPSLLRGGRLAIGFLPAFGEAIEPNDVGAINAVLPTPIVGTFIQVKDQGLEYSQVDPQVHEVLQQKGDRPVLAIALMPNAGLDMIDESVADAIAGKMKAINDQGVPVWLRFGHEMKCVFDWLECACAEQIASCAAAIGINMGVVSRTPHPSCTYRLAEPAKFIDKWRLIFKAIKKVTTKTWMLWSPNMLFSDGGDLNAIKGGYTPYWPGAEFVDLVGLSMYFAHGTPHQNVLPTQGFVKQRLQQFDKAFATPYRKPLVLSETSASYSMWPDGRPTTTNATAQQIKLEYLRQLLAPETKQAAPSFVAFTWFEIKKEEGDPKLVEDFRLVTGSEGTRNAALILIRGGS